MDTRKNFLTQTGLNGTSLTTVAAAAAMSLGGAQTPQAQLVATDQRLVGSAASKAGFGAASPLSPYPISEVVKAVAGATAVLPHSVTWRTTPQDPAHPSIQEADFFWMRGGPVHPEANRYRYHLQVNATSEVDALNQVRHVVENAGGDASDVEVVRHDPERIRKMTEAVEKARRH